MFFEPYPPSEVADGVWVGGRPSPASLGALRAAGVTHVLNVSTDPHGAQVRRDFRATWVPVVDDLEPKPASWFRRGLSFARRALADPSCQLYVHCRIHHPRSRTGCGLGAGPVRPRWERCGRRA